MSNKKKILIITNGTRGDVDPFIGLAQGLIKRGHTPIICAPIAFKNVIMEHGIDYAYMNNGLPKIVKSEIGRSIMESSASVMRYVQSGVRVKAILRPSYRRQLDETYRAAQNTAPDLIIFNHVAIYGYHVARELHIPAMVAISSPILIPTADMAHLLFPQLSWLNRFGGWYNRMTYHVFFKIVELVSFFLVREWQVENKFERHSNKIVFYKKAIHRPRGDSKSLSKAVNKLFNKPLTIMHHYSSALSPRAKDWGRNILITGYWFRKDKKRLWQPPKTLVDFIAKCKAQGKPPIYVGFGSMTASRKTMQRVITTVGKTVEATDIRLVVGVGWSKHDWQAMAVDNPAVADRIYYLDEAPHDWLFPQMAGIMHHGGAGTTAAAFRAMKPSIICPFFADQHFWARRVRATHSGIGSISLKKINQRNLTAAFHQITTDKKMIANAKKIGAQINREDGVAVAIKLIEAM
ncbi:MAG: glycosyltransferase [Hydrotalea sp.]|nr:glycosyltransferase [Hydrotalea sp.]